MRLYRCIDCGEEHEQKSRHGTVPKRCRECYLKYQATLNPTKKRSRGTRPRSEQWLLLASEVTRLRLAVQDAYRALTYGNPWEAEVILQLEQGVPPWPVPEQPDPWREEVEPGTLVGMGTNYTEADEEAYMSCPSQRSIVLDPTYNRPYDENDIQQVQCSRPRGHLPHTRHRGVLDDGTAVEWDGADVHLGVEDEDTRSGQVSLETVSGSGD